MKRFRRWLFNGIAAISLLLCVAMAGMWARSYWRADFYGFTSSNSVNGRLILGQTWQTRARVKLSFVWDTVDNAWEMPSYLGHREIPSLRGGMGYRDNTFLERRGFRFWFFHGTGSALHQKSAMGTGCTFPHWFGVLLLLALPTRWTFLNRRNLRESGTCKHCGYDLRATPDRCPECGTIPPGKKVISN
ncbi:MAG: hypothetical protein ABSH08_22480 [Tepidisphaeraceae bacterium]|jgi:hypothetical protein